MNFIKKKNNTKHKRHDGHGRRNPFKIMLRRCSRVLTIQNIRRVAESVLTNEKRGYHYHSELIRKNKYGAVLTVGLSVPRYRIPFPSRGQGAVRVFNTITKLKQLPCSKSCSARRSLSSIASARTSSVVTQQAQIACQRLFNINTSFSRRIAQAFSLALTRSSLIVPGIILAFTSGQDQLAWAEELRGLPAQKARRSSIASGFNILAPTLVFSFVLHSLVEYVILLVRALYLGVLFSPSIIMAPFADAFGPCFRELWLRVVLWTLQSAGPAFIKWGQWATARPDLFPRDFCNELSKLHSDKAPEHSFAYTRKTVEAAFGLKLSEIFDSFEEVPVASGRIAQVHRASLNHRYPTGQQKTNEPTVVAVKVVHPGVEESIKRDIVIISFVAKVCNVIPSWKWLRLDENVQQFAALTMSQVNLSKEATHLSRFNHYFQDFKFVFFPEPVYPFVHPAVLVETYEEGENISRYVDEHNDDRWLKSAICSIETDALLQMLMGIKLVHADMHPGNILVRVDQKKSFLQRLFRRSTRFRPRPNVIFLDVGRSVELSSSDERNIWDFFKAFAYRDGRGAAECVLRWSKQQNCPNPKGFIEEVDEAFASWGTWRDDNVPPEERMHQLLEKARHHRVNIDGNVCTAIATIMDLQGWQRKLHVYSLCNVMGALRRIVVSADRLKDFPELMITDPILAMLKAAWYAAEVKTEEFWADRQ